MTPKRNCDGFEYRRGLESTLGVDAPCTYISASDATRAFLERW